MPIKKIILTILLISIVGCSRSVVIRRAEMSTLRDVAIKKDEPSPGDGVWISWERYEHLLLKEVEQQSIF